VCLNDGVKLLFGAPDDVDFGNFDGKGLGCHKADAASAICDEGSLGESEYFMIWNEIWERSIACP